MKSKLKTSGSPNRAHSMFAGMIRASHPLLKAAITLFAFAAFLTACEGPLSIRFPLTGSVVISNTSADTPPRTGDYLSARYVRGNGTNVPAWQWLADGVAIPGANGQVYRVAEEDRNKTLKVRVSFSGNTSSVESSATAPVARGPDVVCRTVFELSNWLNYPLNRDRTPLTRANSISDPYVIELNVDSISNSQLTLKEVLIDNQKKNPYIYVYIDLSGSNITTIPSNAFYDYDVLPATGCDTLVGITIPSTVTSIEDLAFMYCTNLTSVTIPSSVTSIGQSAFRDCASLKEITIPASVTSIGIGAFENCISLESVNIPSGVTSIGNFVFNGCERLASVNIPSGVASIGYSAFNGCTGLTYITIPDSVTSIGSWAFNGCTGLAGITIGSGVASIDGNSFSNCSNITNVTIRTNKVTNTTSDNWGTRFPAVENVTLQGVTSIDNYAFNGTASLKSVTIPSTVTSIGTGAFRYCTSLASVTIPSTVTTIGQNAFSNCTSLTSVTIPDSVTSIGISAFGNCTALASVTIGQGVTTIGTDAFLYCNNLKNVTIRTDKDVGSWANIFPDAEIVKFEAASIPNSAFSSSSSLTSVNIGSSVKSIEGRAFLNCQALTSVNMGSSVKNIGEQAFTGCNALTSVIIPDSVTTIEAYAFWGCIGLKSVTIGSGVTSIGSNVFSDCSALTSVTFKGTIPSSGLHTNAFGTNTSSIGDLRDRFYASNSANGTPGTYTKSGSGSSITWTIS